MLRLFRLRFAIAGLLAGLAPAMAPVSSLAQAQDETAFAQLPSAPEPQRPKPPIAPSAADSRQQDFRPERDPAAAAGTPAPAPDTPVLTMFPHAEDAWYWISGQANVILQGRLPFHSPYQGPNSFRNSAEYKTSMVGTLYTAVRRNRSVRYNTDFIFDLESAGGRGLSEALGLAGFTNLDVVRNPNLGSTPTRRGTRFTR